MPESEKSIDRLTDEGVLFVVAGNETTGNALSIITYNILNTPQTMKKLKEELVAAIPDPTIVPKWQDLEKLPYLVRKDL